jgi:hypothetical protein
MAAKKKDAEAVEETVSEPEPEVVEHVEPEAAASVGEYRDNEDKPDPTTVAQVQIVE